MTIEETVQRKLGDIMPVMGPERWEKDVRPAIVRVVANAVHEARNLAQVAMIEMHLKHERALLREQDIHKAELVALQQLLSEALQGGNHEA